MNSRGTRHQPHRGDIYPAIRDDGWRRRIMSSEQATFKSDGGRLIETADQAPERPVSRRLIPVRKDRIQRRFLPHRRDDRAEDAGHPQQCRKTPGETDASEARKHDENDHSQAKANEHPGRSEFFRKILKLGHLMSRLREIVAVHRLVERIRRTRHGGHAGPAWQRGLAPRVDECAQDRQRQIGVMAFDRSIVEPVGKFALR